MVDLGRSSMGLQNTQYDFLVLGLGFGSNMILCLELDEDEEMSSFCHVLLLPQLGAGDINICFGEEISGCSVVSQSFLNN